MRNMAPKCLYSPYAGCSYPCQCPIRVANPRGLYSEQAGSVLGMIGRRLSNWYWTWPARRPGRAPSSTTLGGTPKQAICVSSGGLAYLQKPQVGSAMSRGLSSAIRFFLFLWEPTNHHELDGLCRVADMAQALRVAGGIARLEQAERRLRIGRVILLVVDDDGLGLDRCALAALGLLHHHARREYLHGLVAKPGGAGEHRRLEHLHLSCLAAVERLAEVRNQHLPAPKCGRIDVEEIGDLHVGVIVVADELLDLGDVDVLEAGGPAGLGVAESLGSFRIRLDRIAGGRHESVSLCWAVL